MLWGTGAWEKEIKESPLQMRRARRKGGKHINIPISDPREEREENTQYPNLRPIHQRAGRKEELWTVNGKITNLSCGEGSVGTSFIILLWNMLEYTRTKKHNLWTILGAVPKLDGVYIYLHSENICIWYLLEGFHHKLQSNISLEPRSH